MSASIFDDEPQPTPLSSSDHFFDVQHVIGSFRQAAEGRDVALCLSNALCSLEGSLYRKGRQTLTAEERFDILRALECAYRAAWRRLSPDFPRPTIVSGFRAVATQVDFWHRPPEVGNCDTLRDAKALARVFRNELHNVCLLAEVRERADHRSLFGADSGSVFDDPPAVAFIAAA